MQPKNDICKIESLEGTSAQDFAALLPKAARHTVQKMEDSVDLELESASTLHDIEGESSESSESSNEDGDLEHKDDGTEESAMNSLNVI